MIEFTTGLLMLASAFTPATAQKVEAKGTSLGPLQTSTIATTQEIHTVTSAKHLSIAETEIVVRNYFKDTPILAEISKCESSFRQYDKEGKVLTGIVNNDDIGIMQINTFYHGETAENLGLDIYTLKGNLEYAKVLYGRSGDKPWVHSSPCWSKSLIAKI